MKNKKGKRREKKIGRVSAKVNRKKKYIQVKNEKMRKSIEVKNDQVKKKKRKW